MAAKKKAKPPAKAKTPPKKNPATPRRSKGEPDVWNLRLYVAGQTPKSLAAIANLKKICEENLAGRYKLEVIDLVVTPQLAAGDQIVAIPTLVRRLPPPLKRMIGDLSNSEKVIVGLDLRPVGRVAP